MKRKMVVALSVATLAIFVLFIALPIFTAPVTAVSIPAVYDNQSEQPIESLAPPIDWTPYFDNRGFNFSDSFLSAQFTHRWRVDTRFGLDFAKLIEFNDLDDDKFYNETIDTFINEYNLRTDIIWNTTNIEINWTQGNQFPDSIRIIVTGQSTDQENAFQIEFLVTLYFTAETISFNDTTVTVPAEVALKFGLNIIDYNWADDPTPDDTRYLALVINLHACLCDSYQYRYRWANGEVVANGRSSGSVPSIVNDESVSEVYFIDDSGNPVALFNWFNGAYNGSEFGEGYSYFCLKNETLTISIAFAYNDFPEGDIYIDPYFQLLEGQQNYLPSILTFNSLSQIYASQATSTLLLYGAIAAAVVLMGIAVVLIRRR